VETESTSSHLDKCSFTVYRSKATTRLAKKMRPEKVRNFLKGVNILEQKSHSQWAAEVDADLEDRGLESFHHFFEGQSSTAPHTKRFDRHQGHTPFDAVFEDGCQTSADVARPGGRVGLEIVDDGLVCPVRFLTPAPMKEVSSQRKRPMVCYRQIGYIDPIMRIQIKYPATRHDQVAVFLNNHRVRLQSSSKGLDHVEVQSKAIGIGHISV